MKNNQERQPRKKINRDIENHTLSRDTKTSSDIHDQKSTEKKAMY